MRLSTHTPLVATCPRVCHPRCCAFSPSSPGRADTVLQLFEVVQSQPVTFPPEVPASQPLTDLLLRMLEKVGGLFLAAYLSGVF